MFCRCRYNFDLSLVSQILQKAISLFYSFALIDFTREVPWTSSSSDYSLQYLSLINNYNHAFAQSQLCVLQVWDLDRMDDGDVDSLPNFKEGMSFARHTSPNSCNRTSLLLTYLDWKNVITNGIINIDSNVAVSQCEKFVASVRFRSVKELGKPNGTLCVCVLGALPQNPIPEHSFQKYVACSGTTLVSRCSCLNL